MEYAKFGPAGCGETFAAEGHTASADMPEFLRERGLDAFEYQCGRGVRVSEDARAAMRTASRASGVTVSLHAPYFISMSSTNEAKRLRSVDYILESAKAVRAMGGDRVVAHTGSCGKLPRGTALALAKDTVRRALEALDREGLGDVHICPETMGKVNQLGDLGEVLAVCSLDERLIPCVDFGHLNARSGGEYTRPGAYRAALDAIESALGAERLRSFHIHFSKIEYTSGGEKRHLTFRDEIFGPPFEPLMDELARRGCHPTVICESAGTQVEDAAEMKNYYMKAVRGDE